MRLRATSRANLVLPEPPTPVRVKSRVVASSRFTSNMSCSRPTKLLLCAGRLCWGVIRGWRVLPVLTTSRLGDAGPTILQEPQEVRYPCALTSRGGCLSHADHDALQGGIAHPPNG